MAGFAENFLAGFQGGKNALYAEQEMANQNALMPLKREAMELDIAGARQSMAFDAEKMTMARREVAERAAAAIKSQADAEALAATLEQGKRLLTAVATGGPGADMAWREIAAGLGNPDLELTRDTFALAGEVAGGLDDALLSAAGNARFGAPEPEPDYIEMNGQLVNRNAPGGPAVAPVQGLQQQPEGFRPATPDEAAQFGAQAGQIDEKTGRFYPINPPKGVQITSDGRGGFTLTEGPGVGGADTGRMKPSDPNAMIASIDGILNDPALDFATGWLEWTQKVPGTASRRFGARVNQLNGQAFLQAFEALKGAGQITEIEGTKATQAIGRLDSAQSPEDYRAALTELRGILAEASTRPEGWVDSAQRRQIAPFSAAEANAMTPDQILSMGPDALTRFPVGQLDWSDAQWDALEALAAQEEAQRGAR